MFIKQHLSGICVAYPEDCGGGTGERIHGLSDGRAQGSHYSGQKKRIADAVAYLQQVARPDCRPLVFVATSPGFVDRANEPKFISKLVDNLRDSHGMEHYIWVREFTGHGYPHFHFIANIPLKKRKKYRKWNGQQYIDIPFDPVQVSLYWSRLFGSEANNSIRIGSKPKPGQPVMIYLSKNRRKAWYLAKYIGKSRGDCEGNARIKPFHMDQKTSAAIEPKLFRSKYITEMKVQATWNAQKRCFEDQVFNIPTGERIFEDEKGNLFCPHGIDWRSVGHDVWVGFEKN